jgi:hypothetical protein
VPVGARWWHQGGNAVDQLQRREVSSSALAPRLSLVGSLRCLAQRYTSAALFAQTFHGKGWAGAVAQQALQGCAVVRFDAHPGIDRKPLCW